MGRVFVVGVGMTKVNQKKSYHNQFVTIDFQFYKPGTAGDYPELAKEAIVSALNDSGVSYDQVERVTVGFVYGK